MKKLVLFALEAAMMVAGACQKSNVGAPEGDTADVTFSIELPADISTKTIGDGTSATELYYAVFSQDGQYIKSLAQTAPAAVVGKVAQLKLQLVKHYTYTVVFWAQAPGAPYTFTPETATVKVSYKGNANDEKRDAFCQVQTVVVPDASTFTENVYLRRPFAQINFGAKDYAPIKELGLSMTSTVQISGLADTYDILNGTVSGEASTELAAAAVPAEELVAGGKKYGYVSMNYILAPVNEYDADGKVVVAQSELANVSATFTYNGKNVQVDVPNVPFQRNFRTNIVGDFFTGNVTFNIIVEEDFYTPDNTVDLI